MNVSEQPLQSEVVDDAVPDVKPKRALIFPRWFQILFVLSVLAMGAYHLSLPNDRAMANVWVMMLGVVLAFILYVRLNKYSTVIPFNKIDAASSSLKLAGTSKTFFAGKSLISE